MDYKKLPANLFFGLFEEPFFLFRRSDMTISIYNVGNNRLEEGTFPLSEFVSGLRERLSEDNLPSLESFEKHLEEGGESFSIMFSQNFLNDLPDIMGIVLRGIKRKTEDGETVIIGAFQARKIRNVSLGDEITLDQLTGVINKGDIANIAIDFIDRGKNRGTYIVIVDIDYFKYVNDNYGHQYGDYVLGKIATILRTEVGTQGYVGRIGGDEFFIVFTVPLALAQLRDHLQNIRLMFSKAFEEKGPGEDSPLSVSMGAALYPDDADNYNDLFSVADYCLYLAKAKGRNRYIIYTPEKHPSLKEILQRKDEGRGMINGREDLPLGDVLVQVQYKLRYDSNVNVRKVLSELMGRFSLPSLFLVDKADNSVLLSKFAANKKAEYDPELLFAVIDRYIEKSEKNAYGIYVCNNINHLPAEFKDVVKDLKKQDLISFIVIPFTDSEGKEFHILTGSFGTNTVWNSEHFMYFRLLSDSLSESCVR